MRGRAWLSGPALPLLGAAVGLLVGLAVTLLQDSTYRADASVVLVRQGQPPGADPQLARAAEAAVELFDSRAVAESALRNLALDEEPRELLDRVGVEAAEGSSLVRISVAAPSTEEARRTAQEVAEVATVLFNDRFAPQTTASVWDPAVAVAERVSPKPARNLALGLLIGALVGLGIVLVGLGRPKRASGRRPVPVPAAPAPAPAARAAAAAPVAAPVAAGPFTKPGHGEWTIGDVERLVSEHGGAFPDRREELELYVDSFRAVADTEGRLPGDVALVLEDVFAPLLDRAAERP